MKWEDVDARYPQTAMPPVDRATACTAVRYAYHEAFMAFGYGAGGSKDDRDYWKSVCALLGAALAGRDLQIVMTGA